MIWVILIVAVIVIFVFIKPYIMKYDTVVAFTGGLGTGKSFMSVETAIRELKKNRFRTKLYNFFHRKKDRLEKPMLYSSIPIRISKKEYSCKLTPEMLLLQEGFIKGSIVFIDEVDVFANQFAYANQNIIECANKKDLKELREGNAQYDSGLFDEEIRLFRHLYSSRVCECKLICNSQATSNITTIIRRRMNTVFVLSRFRVWKVPVLSWLPLVGWLFKIYTVQVRNITITDEITNMSDGNAEDNMRIAFGFVPSIRHYDTHCYKHRSDSIPVSKPVKWLRLTTERLMKAPIDYYKNKSKSE